MACIKVWMQVVCIAAAYASPQCALFNSIYYPFSFDCFRPYLDQGSVFISTCAVRSNWDYPKRTLVTYSNGQQSIETVQSYEYTPLPPRPIRWLCPIDARPMPEMQVVYESNSLPDWQTSVTLNPGSPSGHIDNVNSEQFPMVDDCDGTYKKFNKDSREEVCWKFRQMPHFSKQFNDLYSTVISESLIRGNLENLPEDAFPVDSSGLSYNKISQVRGVSECLILKKQINFQQYSCFIPKESNDLQVWIRPTYKFYPGLSNRDSYLNLCVFMIQPDAVTDYISTYYSGVDSDMPTYPKNNVEYIPFPNLEKSDFTNVVTFRAYMKCTILTLIPGKLFGNGNVEPSSIGYIESGQIQPLNIKTTRTTPTCPDFVSHACFYNAYSFYGRACSWVEKTGNGMRFELLKEDMQDILNRDSKDTLWENFRSYGNGNFEVDLQGFKLQVSYNKNDGRGFQSWTGSVNIANSHIIKISPQTGYSCLGCRDLGKHPVYYGVKDTKLTEKDDNAYAPLECRVCSTNERVPIPGYIGQVRKDWNKCEECEKHEIRDYRDPKVQSACATCQTISRLTGTESAIYPMRVTGTLECTACKHMQYFVGSTAAGCLWYVSVSDYISGFNAISGFPLFLGANGEDPRDEVLDAFAKIPRPVGLKKYRNLKMGESWLSSTEEASCESNVDKIVNYTAINMTNATRNTQPQKLYYRQWCGHHEITRHSDALLRKQQILPSPVIVVGYVTLQIIKRECVGQLTVLGDTSKQEMIDNRIAEFKCTNVSHQFLYELRRDGQSLPCTVCPGFLYTRECWPTYHPNMSTVDAVYFSTDAAKPSPGTCSPCSPRCGGANQFFEVSLFSCWSNGTTRIAGADHGRLDRVQARVSQHANYWYKEAVCRECPKLDGFEADERRPALVTRCGNKASFETWHPDEVVYLNSEDLSVPKIRECCSVKDEAPGQSSVAPTFDQSLDAYCITKENNAAISCAGTIPDLATETQPYCPPGWYVIETCAADSAGWTPKCCSKCEPCSLGKVKTREYRTCPGDTFFDTQSEGCKTDCLSGNYRDGDFCYPCETCMT